MPSSTADAAKRRYTNPFVRDPARVPQNWRFDQRQQALLLALYEHEGFLTSCQLEALLYASDDPTKNPRSAKRSAETKLQHLFHASFVDRIKIDSLSPGRSGLAYTLDTAGVDYVASTLGLARTLVDYRPKIEKNKPTSHYHALRVNDFRIVIERGVRQTDQTLTSWIGERALKSKEMRERIPYVLEGDRKSYKKAPDSFFTVEYPAAAYPDNTIHPVGFFVEVDRGTESHSVWAQKVGAYEEFRWQGWAEEYYGVKHFRVLVTVSSPDRLNNLVETTQREAQKGKFYWFTGQDQVDIFRPQLIWEDIWMVPGWVGVYSLRSLKL